jgi:hypothetical protein
MIHSAEGVKNFSCQCRRKSQLLGLCATTQAVDLLAVNLESVANPAIPAQHCMAYGRSPPDPGSPARPPAGMTIGLTFRRTARKINRLKDVGTDIPKVYADPRPCAALLGVRHEQMVYPKQLVFMGALTRCAFPAKCRPVMHLWVPAG